MFKEGSTYIDTLFDLSASMSATVTPKEIMSIILLSQRDSTKPLRMVDIGQSAVQLIHQTFGITVAKSQCGLCTTKNRDKAL